MIQAQDVSKWNITEVERDNIHWNTLIKLVIEAITQYHNQGEIQTTIALLPKYDKHIDRLVKHLSTLDIELIIINNDGRGFNSIFIKWKKDNPNIKNYPHHVPKMYNRAVGFTPLERIDSHFSNLDID